MLDDARVEAALGFVYKYAPSISDWKTLKRELLKSLPCEARRQFSTRDPITKRQNFNAFENAVCDRWAEITGAPVIINVNENEKKNS